MCKIRLIQESDFETVAKMEVEISIISFMDEAITDIAFHMKRIISAYEKEPSGMFIAIDNNKISGWMWMDKKTNFLTKEVYINFRSFYITDEARGSDCSSLLMQKGIEYAQSLDAKYIVGKVHVDNLPMRSLYKNSGFKPTHLSMQLDL